MRTPDEIVKDAKKYLGAFGPLKFPEEQRLGDGLIAELLALYASEVAAHAVTKEEADRLEGLAGDAVTARLEAADLRDALEAAESAHAVTQRERADWRDVDLGAWHRDGCEKRWPRMIMAPRPTWGPDSVAIWRPRVDGDRPSICTCGLDAALSSPASLSQEEEEKKPLSRGEPSTQPDRQDPRVVRNQPEP